MMSQVLRRIPHVVATSAAALALLLSGCADSNSDSDARPPDPPSGSASPEAPDTELPDGVAEAVSQTREDTVYPQVGDPGVDALHYGLSLAWTPESDTLVATERLTFRATADADRVQLDFDDVLTIDSLTIDGEDVTYDRADKDLLVEHPVRADEQYVLEMAYSGTPEPYAAPTERSDFQLGEGWHVTRDHEVWTIQEPYGAFTWFAANDQPADKAYYDFTLTVPEPWTGIANGALTDTNDAAGLRTTTWHLAEPASSYLVTVAFADYTPTELSSGSGVPVTIWGPTDDPAAIGETEYAGDAIDWLEKYLGPYPFDTAGILIYDGTSGMETQTMITLGATPYATSRAVVVHELAHHWYGDTVTPADWSDVWMNEGMAMYLQGMWEAEDEGITIDQKMDDWASLEADARRDAGPPADYVPSKFGAGNIYYGPALMWNELRHRIGDDAFFALLRDWPADQENGIADRDEYLSWIEDQTGEELTVVLRRLAAEPDHAPAGLDRWRPTRTRSTLRAVRALLARVVGVVVGLSLLTGLTGLTGPTAPQAASPLPTRRYRRSRRCPGCRSRRSRPTCWCRSSSGPRPRSGRWRPRPSHRTPTCPRTARTACTTMPTAAMRTPSAVRWGTGCRSGRGATACASARRSPSTPTTGWSASAVGSRASP